MRESAVESYLRDEAKRAGGRAYKFVSPGNNGVPDRLVCMPGGRVAFVETKAPGRKSTALQKVQQQRLRELGFRVYAEVDSREKVDAIIREMQGGDAV